MNLFLLSNWSRFLATAGARRLLLGALTLSWLPGAVAAATPGDARLTAPVNLPLYFEAAAGANLETGSFLARGRGCNFFVTPTEATLTLIKYELPAEVARIERGPGARPAVAQSRTLHFNFPGANPRARITGAGELTGKVNYLLGKDPARWRTGVPLFARVNVEKIYPGVDLVYYGNERRLEYDFTVAPKTDPRVIALRFTGADQVRLNAQGDLVFALGADEIVQPKPRIYQTVAGLSKEISGGYEFADSRTVRFRIGDYDPELPLVIDPVLGYSTYFGKAGTDIGWDIAVDKSGTNGAIYIAGESTSPNLPVTTTNTFGGGFSAGDVFVAKFNQTGSAISYLTYLGGNGEDGALAITLDSQGNACITGFTTSTNFPTPNGIFTNISGPAYPGLGVYQEDAFIAKLNGTGQLIYSTYLGGTNTDLGVSIAVDSADNVYVSGSTDSTNFYMVNAAYPSPFGQDDVFVAKLNSTGTAFLYTTFIGGINDDHGDGIAVDGAGCAYVTGYTLSTNYPTTPNAPQRYLNNPATNATGYFIGYRDAFITKLKSDGSGLEFSTLIGGALNDTGFRVAVDAETNVYVTGSTLSANFPIHPAWNTNIPQGVLYGYLDVFVAKLAASGTNWVYSVLFGGAGQDEGWDICVDAKGRAHVIGETYSVNFPTINTNGNLRGTYIGVPDVFVCLVNSNGTALLFSAYLGGTAAEFGNGIETDMAGNDYLVGQTFSINFPTVAAYQTNWGGGYDAFVAKILVEPVLHETAVGTNVVLHWAGYSPEFKLQSNTNIVASNGWVTVPTPPVLVNGWETVTLGATNGPRFFRLRYP